MINVVAAGSREAIQLCTAAPPLDDLGIFPGSLRKRLGSLDQPPVG